MPDFNPDKEAHRDHKWIVHDATRKRLAGVHAVGKDLMFNKYGRFSIRDEGVAAEIRQRYPRDVTVTRVSKYHPADRGHKYFFAVPEMPWKKEVKEKGKMCNVEAISQETKAT